MFKQTWVSTYAKAANNKTTENVTLNERGFTEMGEALNDEVSWIRGIYVKVFKFSRTTRKNWQSKAHVQNFNNGCPFP